ncbi:MAG TPA: DeoR/GlpR family DNA-binding transcription regulator [Alphaproteobacteria bacterium]|nr:DeoR/GlpR family DNA-binding transcription regulator [Alphaproteobacteria bacterium]
MANAQEQRVRRLGEAIAERGVLRLRDAASLLGVSEMTVRRDLAAAPGLFAYLGGHIVAAGDIGGPAYALDREADLHARAKIRACEHALALIEPNDTLFLDCGTTLVHLAERLPEAMPLTVLCYALNVCNALSRKPNVRTILLGGLYHPASASFAVDDPAALERYGINKAFLSAGGVDPARGVSCSHFHEVPVKRKALATALEAHLVVDASKIGRVKPAVFAAVGDFRSIVTEGGSGPPK